MTELKIKPDKSCRWDCLSLGEVMLRFCPGASRIHTARSFAVYEGGGEYNVARALRRCFKLRTAVVTSLVDNPIGHLVEDLILQGGVDQSHIKWVDFDGVGRRARNGIYFADRGFGIRGGTACSDRGHTAIANLRPGDIDWQHIFGTEGVRWFHTGGIFAALSDTTPEVAIEAMSAAKQHGTIVSYDLNFRSSLWKERGGRKRSDEVNRRLAPFADVMFGVMKKEPERAAKSTASKAKASASRTDPTALETDVHFRSMEEFTREFPNIAVIAMTLRNARTANHSTFGAICYSGGNAYASTTYKNLEIFDRIGGGDGFAAGLIYGLLTEKGIQWATECGSALSMLVQTTPGDSSMASLAEVKELMQSGKVQIAR